MAQGRVTKIDDVKSLILKPGENRIFAAALAEKAGMALFSVSLSHSAIDRPVGLRPALLW